MTTMLLVLWGLAFADLARAAASAKEQEDSKKKKPREVVATESMLPRRPTAVGEANNAVPIMVNIPEILTPPKEGGAPSPSPSPGPTWAPTSFLEASSCGPLDTAEALECYVAIQQVVDFTFDVPYKLDITGVGFPAPLQITNQYLPLSPGRRWTYLRLSRGPLGLLGFGEDEREVIIVEVAGTNTVTLPNGDLVDCRVVRERVSTENNEQAGDKVKEDTERCYSQDSEGAVWLMAEDTVLFDPPAAARLDGARPTPEEFAGDQESWETGVGAALAGLAMLADPQPQTTYRKNYEAGVHEDIATVAGRGGGLNVTVPADFFDQDLVKTRDFSRLALPDFETTHYAPGVGVVLKTLNEDQARTELLSFSTPGQ